MTGLLVEAWVGTQRGDKLHNAKIMPQWNANDAGVSHSITRRGLACLDALDGPRGTPRRRTKHRRDSGNRIKSEVKREMVIDFIRDMRFSGTLEQLSQALKRTKGLVISTSQLSRFGAAQKMREYSGRPARPFPRKGEREPIARGDDPSNPDDQ